MAEVKLYAVIKSLRKQRERLRLCGYCCKIFSYSSRRYLSALLKNSVLFGVACASIDEPLHSNKQLNVQKVLSTYLRICTGNLFLDFLLEQGMRFHETGRFMKRYDQYICSWLHKQSKSQTC